VNTPALAFRPPSALKRLPRGSRACPLSLRDLVGALVTEESPLTLVLAPSTPVARAALVAAKEAASALGLELPAGEGPERWFGAVTSAADELAPGLPLFLAAEVVLLPEGDLEAVRARRLVHRLVDAGLTHLVLDLDRLAPEARADELARAAEPALERGLGVECLLPAGPDGLPEADEVFSLLAELASLGATPDLAGVRCPAPDGEGDAELQAARLRELAGAAPGVALCRRGPGGGAVARRVGGGVVRAWGDGGAVAAAAAGTGGADGAEGRAYAAAADLLDALGAGGSAVVLSAALARAREA